MIGATQDAAAPRTRFRSGTGVRQVGAPESRKEPVFALLCELSGAHHHSHERRAQKKGMIYWVTGHNMKRPLSTPNLKPILKN